MQQPQQRGSGRHSERRERREGREKDGGEGREDARHRAHVAASVCLGEQYREADGKSRDEVNVEADRRRRGSDRGERRLADDVADDEGVRPVVELLEHAARYQRQAEVRQLARSALKILPHSQPPPFPPARTKKPYAALHTVRDSTRWLFSKFQGQYIKRARKFQQPRAARIYRPPPCSSSAPSRDERSVETKAVPRITAPPASSRSVGNSPMRSAAAAMP